MKLFVVIVAVMLLIFFCMVAGIFIGALNLFRDYWDCENVEANDGENA